MNRKLSLWLAIALMMFPQIAETIYSPALTDISNGFRVSANEAGQTLSLYFLLLHSVSLYGVVYVMSLAGAQQC